MLRDLVRFSIGILNSISLIISIIILDLFKMVSCNIMKYFD